MSKKHFRALADELRAERNTFTSRHSAQAFEDMLDILVGFCKRQNGRFDEDRFRGYVAGLCGPNGGAR